jgi:hypothetical protein
VFEVARPARGFPAFSVKDEPGPRIAEIAAADEQQNE